MGAGELPESGLPEGALLGPPALPPPEPPLAVALPKPPVATVVPDSSATSPALAANPAAVANSPDAAGPATGEPPPPAPPPPAANASGGQPAAAPRGEGPLVQLEGQVLHKRAYGNRLTFLDIQEGDGQQEEEAADDAAGAEGSQMDLEVVFCFEAYGAEVRRVRKDICTGDVVHFEGHFRPIQKRVLEATSYRIVKRWSDRGLGEHFLVKRRNFDRDPGVGAAFLGRGDPSSSSSGPTSFCKFWLSNGACSRPSCRCEHPEGEVLRAARMEYWEAQKKRRAESANPDDPHRSQDKASHAHRAGVLADWLCSTYGLEELRANGVVELAGGRGDLAFELGVKRRIPCTVIDPRCPGGDLPVGPWTGWRLTKPQRAWLQSNVTGVRGFASCQAYVESCPIRQCQACAPADLAAAGEEALAWWAQVVGSCSVVVGLHPDQATGSILALARAFGRPFAAVPCCTFADDFPERVLAGGRPVRTYDDLVEWMRAHAAATELDFLSFHGKNLVVFLRKVSPPPETPLETAKVEN